MASLWHHFFEPTHASFAAIQRFFGGQSGAARCHVLIFKSDAKRRIQGISPQTLGIIGPQRGGEVTVFVQESARIGKPSGCHRKWLSTKSSHSASGQETGICRPITSYSNRFCDGVTWLLVYAL